LALISPPIFGVSRYQPDGLLVTCSWDYTTRTLSNRIYYLYLVVFGFLLPVTVIVFCYSTVFMRIISHDQEMMTMASNSVSQKVRFSKMR
jgi:r-opsin